MWVQEPDECTMCPAHVIFPKKKSHPLFSRDLMKKRREKAVLVDRISRWLFPTRFDCCGHCFFLLLWCNSLAHQFVVPFDSFTLNAHHLFEKAKGDQNLMLTLNLETFKLFQGSLPLHWLHIWSLCSNLWLCFVDSLSYIFHIFSFILLNIVYWALFGDHDLWWSSIFPKPRSSQILDLLADGKWLLPIDGCWSTSNRCGCPRYQVSWCSDTRYGYGYESPWLTSSQLHSRISRKPRVCRRQKDPVYAGFTVILFQKSIATKAK